MRSIYGLKNVNNTQRIPLKYLKHEGTLTIGKQIKVTDEKFAMAPLSKLVSLMLMLICSTHWSKIYTLMLKLLILKRLMKYRKERSNYED